MKVYVFAYINSCYVQIEKRRKKAKIKDIQNSIKKKQYISNAFFRLKRTNIYKSLNRKPFLQWKGSTDYTYTYTN